MNVVIKSNTRVITIADQIEGKISEVANDNQS